MLTTVEGMRESFIQACCGGHDFALLSEHHEGITSRMLSLADVDEPDLSSLKEPDTVSSVKHHKHFPEVIIFLERS